MNGKSVLIFFFSMVFGLYLRGQVLPPVINCVTNDTVFYTPVMNTCGAFLSYDIFTSNSPAGPFSQLTIVTDENLTFFAHPNSSSQVAYYYMVPNYDCPGEVVVNSDTISNRPPEEAILQTVSVDGIDLIITWDPSPSPETDFYSVFLLTDSGLEFVADVNGLSYTDPLRNPNQSTISYLIVAIDVCGNQSTFGQEVTSMLLSVDSSPCEETILFDWNLHNNATRQELWAVSTGGTEVLLSDLANDAENFTLDDIPNIELNGFFIKAFIDGNNAFEARSNVIQTNTDISIAMDEIFFTRISAGDDNTLSIDWCWNESADLSAYEINYSKTMLTDSKVQAVFSGLSPTVSEQINVINTNEESYLLNVLTTDACDRTFSSSDISSIQLTVVPRDEFTIQVAWNEFVYADASLDSYILHEVRDGNDAVIYEGMDSQFPVQVTEQTGEVCYYVEATATGTLNNGDTKNTRVISNISCSKGFPIVRMPNAFNPYGVNNIFKPLFGNTDAITGYDMRIFSRYGELLFSTTSLEEGWNGRNGLRELPQGVYSYLVAVDVLGGEMISLQGSVLLIR